MALKNLEQFFLNTLLKISLGGVILVLVTDALFYPTDTTSITIDVVILIACTVAFLMRLRYPVVPVLILTGVILAAMFYQSLLVPANTTTSLSILLVVGAVYSVLLKGRIMWCMHLLTFMMIQSIFILQYLNPTLRVSKDVNDVITIAVTYSILYFILSYAAAVLKSSYDKIHLFLRQSNQELNTKATEIALQNEKLLQIQENLNALNLHLEQIVNERTAKIQEQNSILLKYSYTNAHHLRGPVARLLGLANLYKLQDPPPAEFIIDMMHTQAQEIDAVIQQINVDLDNHNLKI